MRAWKHGDPAMVLCDDMKWRLANFHIGQGFGFVGRWALADGTYRHPRDTRARPVVVIDPEDREQIARLSKRFHESDHIAPWHDLHKETRSQIADAMQVALRSLVAAPKPEEPTGDLAVVINGEQMRYYRTPMGTWHRFSDGLERPWSHIDARRILSPGVEVDQ